MIVFFALPELEISLKPVQRSAAFVNQSNQTWFSDQSGAIQYQS